MAIVYFDNYRQNRTNDGIYSRERITVKCDFCTKTWQTQYSNYKSKKSDIDLCISCRNSNGITGMGGKKHSMKTRIQMSKTRIGKNNSFFGKYHSEQTKMVIKKALKGRNCRKSSFGEAERHETSIRVKRFWDSMTDEQKKRQMRGLRSWRTNGRLSKIHQKVRFHMRKRGLNGFMSEEYINGFWIDEYHPVHKIAVEINGDYWHANPKFYSKNYYNKRIKLTAVQIWEKDLYRTNILKDLGIKVFFIWEYQTKKTKLLDTELEKIKQCIIQNRP